MVYLKNLERIEIEVCRARPEKAFNLLDRSHFGVPLFIVLTSLKNCDITVSATALPPANSICKNDFSIILENPQVLRGQVVSDTAFKQMFRALQRSEVSLRILFGSYSTRK